MSRLLSQVEADRVRATLKQAGVTLIAGSLALHDNKIKFSLQENSSLAQNGIKALLNEGIDMKQDDFDMPIEEAMKTDENLATDRPDGMGGCDCWILLGNTSGPVFRT